MRETHLNTTFPVKVEVTQDGRLVAGEGEHGQRHGDGHVDPNLSSLDLKREFASSCTRVGEDGRAVAVLVFVDHGNGSVQRVDFGACLKGKNV